MKRTCTELGVRQGDARCDICINDEHIPLPSEAASINPEAGNVWFVGNESDDGMPVTPFEAIFFYLCIAAGGLVSVAVMAGLAGWIYQTFFN